MERIDRYGDELSDDGSSSDDDEMQIGLNRLIRERNLMLRQFHPLEHCPPAFFRKHYRMSQDLARQLFELIRDDFDVAQRQSHIPADIEFCVGVRLYATGGYQSTIAQYNFSATCQAGVCRILERFTNSLLTLADRLIYVPKSRAEREEISNSFLRYTRIPGVLGLIDGLIVKILKPSENEEAFYNYQHKHSLNVQLVSDDKFLIRSVRICPGSNADSNVWNHSDIKQFMESLRCDFNILINEGAYYLIGDSGYPLSPVMLTPIRRIQPGTPRATYTREVGHTRSRQERLNAKLVNKWRILKRERMMRYEPTKAARILIGGAVLHNFIILDGEIDHDLVVEDVHQDMVLQFNHDAGEREREYLLHQYFGA